MEEVRVDTERIRKCGEDILKLVEELKLTYNDMFEKIEGIPDKSKIWAGETAQQYVAHAKNYKPMYMNFLKDLYKYGQYLVKCASEYDRLIGKVRR